MVDSIRIISLNCWGLKYLSKYRSERLSQIGTALAEAQPSPELVGLQECWTQEDYNEIRTKTRHILPYAKYYYSGAFGSGLAILSKWPIVESTMHKYSLNGRPTAFFRGDWFVGKGVACATIRIDRQQLEQDRYTTAEDRSAAAAAAAGELVDVFCTHLHAPYEKEPNDSYLCHRTSQAWEMSKLLQAAAAKGRLAIAMGDFNMIPSSLAHRLITTHGPAIDTWQVLWPQSSLGAAVDTVEKARGLAMPSARTNIKVNGATCDSILNTWRYTKSQARRLKQGKVVFVSPDDADPQGKRLDYVFLGGSEAKVNEWNVTSASLGMLEVHPHLKVSLSDHFSVEVTIAKSARTTGLFGVRVLPKQTYDDILQLTQEYTQREQQQRRWRIGHFFAWLSVSVGCLVAVWWSPRNFASFILMTVSTLGLATGVVDGLIGLLFMSWELRCLKEFSWEMENARGWTTEKPRGGQVEPDMSLDSSRATAAAAMPSLERDDSSIS